MPMPLSAIGQRAGVLVGREADLEFGVLDQKVGVGDRLVAQPVAGIRGVGNQLAQENIGLGIDRMHHQPQKFGDLSLE
jgi:hypothetical protein